MRDRSAAREPPEERTGHRTGGPEPTPSASDGESDGVATDVTRCDLCGGPMIDRHCKLLCTTCGYQRDCSDP